MIDAQTPDHILELLQHDSPEWKKERGYYVKRLHCQTWKLVVEPPRFRASVRLHVTSDEWVDLAVTQIEPMSAMACVHLLFQKLFGNLAAGEAPSPN